LGRYWGVVVAFCTVLFACFAFSAPPAITSTTNPAGVWSNSSHIIMKLSLAGASGYSYAFDSVADTVPDETIDTADSRVELGGKADGIYWFHARAKTAAGWSEAAHYQLKVDTTGSLRPNNIAAASQPDGSVKITWDASVDATSGIAYYNVYRSTLRFVKDGELSREFTIKDIVAKKVGPKITGTSFTDTNFIIGEGFRFHYKVQPVDNAGNGGTVSMAASVQTISNCDFDVSVDAVFKDNNLAISVASGSSFKAGRIVVVDPAGSETIVAEKLANSAYDAGYPMAGRQNGDYNISFTSLDNDNDVCAAGKIFVYDTAAPEVKILSPSPKEVLSDVAEFKFDASDKGINPSGVALVSLFYENGDSEQRIGDAKPEGGFYVFDWNTTGIESGRFKVVARAIDRGGNSGESFSIYSFRNTALALSRASTAISDANTALLAAQSYLKRLQDANIGISDLNVMRAAADSNMASSLSLFREGLYYDLAVQRANEAKKLYNSAISAITVSDYNKSGTYTYNKNQLDVLLPAAGLDKQYVAAAKRLIASTASSRKLNIQQIKAPSGTYYRAGVTITLSKPIDYNGRLDIIEVIPKSFAAAAQDITSTSEFEVLSQDPVIAFKSVDFNGSKRRELSYVLNANLKKAQVDALVAAPPIVLESSSKLPQFSSSGTLGLSSFSLPSIDFNSGNMVLLIVAAVAVLFILFLMLLVAVFAIYYFFVRSKRK